MSLNQTETDEEMYIYQDRNRVNSINVEFVPEDDMVGKVNRIKNLIAIALTHECKNRLNTEQG